MARKPSHCFTFMFCILVLLLFGDSWNEYSCADILLLYYANPVDGQQSCGVCVIHDIRSLFIDQYHLPLLHGSLY